jgi:hypothetical protein
MDDETANGDFDRFEVRKEYEGVAMHFNDLIIRLRSQSLGAVAAFATSGFRWELLTGAFGLLIVFWIAILVLDLGYYNRLLIGSVKALKAIEVSSLNSPRIDRLVLSTTIEDAVIDHMNTGSPAQVIFYMMVLFALLAGAIFSAVQWMSPHSP